jgi:nucleotide-binding universal stress UspA family protein
VTAYKTVLVGTDGSETSFKAVDRAAEVAHGAGAKLVILCAYRPMAERDRAKAADQLGDLSYKVAGSHPAEDIVGDASVRAGKVGQLEIVPVVVEGDASDVIMEQVKKQKADLVVIGNRGLNSIAGRLLGSVPQTVTHRSHVDVLVVHTTGR